MLADAAGPEIALECVETGRKFVCGVAVHLDAQERPGIALDECAAQTIEGQVLFRVVEDETVHHLDGRRMMREDRRRRGEGPEQIGELDGHHRLGARQRDQCDTCLEDHGECALGSDDHARHVEAVSRTVGWRDEGVEVVSADASKDFRERAGPPRRRVRLPAVALRDSTTPRATRRGRPRRVPWQ